MALPTSLLLAPTDSARVVGDVYAVSLLATLPLAAAALGLLAFRGASAGTRQVLWRSVLVALLVILAGRLIPVHIIAWVVPEGLAAPLVALGRAQLVIAGALPGEAGRSGAGGEALLRGLAAVYWAGVVVVMLPTVWGRWRLRRLMDSATPCDAPAWRATLHAAAHAAGLPPQTVGTVRLGVSQALRAPLTWGMRRPAILLPSEGLQWTDAQRYAALVHELSHVRHADTLFTLAARVACGLLWFHPGVWWLAARLASDGEMACDDRVLLTGVRRSDYAELLAMAAAVGGGRSAVPAGAVSLIRRAGLRERLTAIVDTSRTLRAPSASTALAAVLSSALLALPIATVQVAPTRGVLTSLMHDTRWESRAYAVVRLAQRADSIQVARDAARHDPNPRVRAWAQFALSRESVMPASAVSPTGEATARPRPALPTILN